MPGLFGGIACNPSVLEILRREFSAIWEDYSIKQSHDSLIGGHAFHPATPVLSLADGRLLGLDGEASFYEDFALAGRSPKLPFSSDAGEVRLLSPAVGNIAVVDSDSVGLAADWTGSFPLYYAESDGGLLFSSHLRPLARALSAEPDTAGVVEFLTEGFTIGHRTPFRGIKRLLGGQSLRFSPHRGVTITEHSEAGTAVDRRLGNGVLAAEDAATALATVFQDLPKGDSPPALMMSAGWDSRTLLALASSGGVPAGVSCYSHGDLASRELRLARQVCQARGVPWRAEPLDDRLYDMEALSTGFARTENVVFPHWHRAGRLLAQEKARFVLAGVFGEMLGGRYWIAHANTGVRKALTLFPELMRRNPAPEPTPTESRNRSRQMFRWKNVERPWFFDRDAIPDPTGTLAEINGDVEASFDRYESRGVTTLNQLAEAYQGEHIGSRYCNVQLLSCRAHVDIAMPLANRRVLSVAMRTPIHTRMQNQLNRQIIRELDPQLLSYPMAATLLPASTPIVWQEASRVLRKGVQGSRWALHFGSGGRIPPTRLAWANYEFLRNGKVLRQIVEELRSDFWDTSRMHGFVDTVGAGQWHEQMLHTSDLIAKILTLDMLLR